MRILNLSLYYLHAKRPASSPRSNAWNEDSGDGSGEEADELATGTKQKRALEEQEHERELSAYERQRTAKRKRPAQPRRARGARARRLSARL